MSFFVLAIWSDWLFKLNSPTVVNSGALVVVPSVVTSVVISGMELIKAKHISICVISVPGN